MKLSVNQSNKKVEGIGHKSAKWQKGTLIAQNEKTKLLESTKMK